MSPGSETERYTATDVVNVSGIPAQRMSRRHTQLSFLSYAPRNVVKNSFPSQYINNMTFDHNQIIFRNGDFKIYDVLFQKILRICQKFLL